MFQEIKKFHGKIIGIALLIMISLFIGSCASAEVKGARDGDLNAVREYVESGGDVNMRQDKGMTLLMYASAGGHVHVIEYLVRVGAKISIRDDRGYTALIHGTEGNKLNSVTSLLSYFAPINETDNAGRTALLIAASRNYSSIVSTLLDKGADYKLGDSQGWTPLMAALNNSASTSSGVTPSYKLLEEAGASLNSPSSLADTIAFAALKSGNREVLAILFNAGTSPGLSDREDNSLLHLSVNNPEMLSFLLEYNPPLNSRNKAGETPLFAAVKGRFAESAELLLAKGADYSIGDNQGWTPVMTALNQSAADSSGVTPSFRLLQDRGAPLLVPSSQADSITFSAVKSGNRDVLSLLFNAGINPALSDSKGNTLLHYSVNNPELLSFLLGYKLDVNSRNADGESALFTAVKGNFYDSVIILLDKGADPELRNKDGITVLLLAAEKDTAQILNALLLRDVNLFVTDKLGNTALHGAAQKGVAESVRKLLLSGIFVNSTNSTGDMPYDLSFKNAKNGEEIRTILVTAGAIVPEVIAPVGETPVVETPVVETPVVVTPAVEKPEETGPETAVVEVAPVTPAEVKPAVTVNNETSVPAESNVQARESRIVFSWPRITPSRAQGWNNSDKITSNATLTLTDATGGFIFSEKIILPLKGVNADAYQVERTLALTQGQQYKGLFVIVTKKGKSLSSKVTVSMPETGPLDLYFEEFVYE